VHDVAIIGCGVTGAATAWALARYDVDVVVIERGSDVAMGASKANSAILHAGFAAPLHSLKTKYNVEANPLFDEVCADLKVPFARVGSFVVATRDEQLARIEELKKNGDAAGVPGLEIISDPQRLQQMEPALTRNTKAVLWAPTAGILSPYELVIRLSECAAINGARFCLESPVTGIYRSDDRFTITTPRGPVRSRFVVNAAGVYADKIQEMVGLSDFTIETWKGEYILFDHDAVQVNHVLFPMPTKKSKGILVTPTVHGNVIIGPNNVFEPDRENLATTTDGLLEIIDGGDAVVPAIPQRKVITNFCGLRAKASTDDFVVGPTAVTGFFNAAGIQSPGLSACLAIGRDLVRMMGDAGLALRERADYVGEIPDWFRIREADPGAISQVIERDPHAGHVVCRCETVSEKEIVEQIRRPLGATTLDGIKFRTRAQMGRCQGGFCTPKLLKILSRELEIPVEQVTKRGTGTRVLLGRTKGLGSEVWQD
jgi:glycerol-3-phosphate dehydrogenase